MELKTNEKRFDTVTVSGATSKVSASATTVLRIENILWFFARRLSVVTRHTQKKLPHSFHNYCSIFFVLPFTIANIIIIIITQTANCQTVIDIHV
jgi:hypothetical protein